MNLFNHAISLHGVRSAISTGILLLCFSVTSAADPMDDANKLFKQGKNDLAMEQVDTILKSKPKDAQARFLKGLILTDKGKTNDAIHIFTELTVDYPELPEPYNNLAVLYASQGQYDKARIALEMAIRTHPSYATAHENLGDIYAKMASQAYDRALQLDQGNTHTKTKLALIQELFSGEPVKSRTEKPKTTIATAEPVSTAATSAKPATSAPTSTPSSAAESSANMNNTDEVSKAVYAWASSWSDQDVKKYLSFYADDFRVPEGQSRADWESLRTDRLTKPKYIHVTIQNLSIKLDDDTHARATFEQTYDASHFKAHGTKTLMMTKSGNRWLILEESSGR